MDRGKRHVKGTHHNSKIYLDLKDIVRENVLQFLPAKTLFKCTTVCRDWKLLISTPFFAHNQCYSYRGFSGLFVQNVRELPKFVTLDSKSYGVPDPTLSFLPLPVMVRCGSNGLLCCQDSARSYYVCSPVTRQWRKLPMQEGNHGIDPAIVLIYEPSLLGFEAEYQLVCGFKSEDFDGLEFEIYSSAKGSWGISGEISFGTRQLVPGSGVHASGVVYWKTNTNTIFGFDMKKDRTVNIHGRRSLGALDGRLCSFNFANNDLTIEVLSNAHTNTMAMTSRDSGWKQVRQVKFNACSGETNGSKSASGDKKTATQMIERWRQYQDSVLFASYEMVVLKTDKKIIALDLNSKAATVLMTAANTFDNETRFVPYVNSLISL